jgi:hypothetical protein
MNHRTRQASQDAKYKRYYHYLTVRSQQEMLDLLNELISVSDLLGYPNYADIRKNRIRIKVLTPQLYPDAPPKLLGYLSG